jgi:hypothetical protein
LSAEEVFASASPAVVQIAVQDLQGRTVATGSGFLVGKAGLVATNYHVIEEAHAADVVVGKRTLAVSGAAALDQEADVAILRVAGQIEALPLELADRLPRVGAKVYAIGNPKGLTNTLSEGLVSGHRELDRLSLIQMTAPISPGSSGGPLLDTAGRVVGVTTGGVREAQNINFVVPASEVARLLLRCRDRDAPVTPFPLAQRRPVARSAPANQAAVRSEPEVSRPQPLEERSNDDADNAAHFVKAIRASDRAWELCNAAGVGGKPWLMGNEGRRRFAELIGQANQEAKLVRMDVLRQMHPGLPAAFGDFVSATYYIGPNVMSRRPDKRVQEMWRRWQQWWSSNRLGIHLPEGARY